MKKYHVEFTDEPLSEEAINQYQDFDKLLTQQTRWVKLRKVYKMIVGGVGVTTLAVATWLYFPSNAPTPLPPLPTSDELLTQQDVRPIVAPSTVTQIEESNSDASTLPKNQQKTQVSQQSDSNSSIEFHQQEEDKAKQIVKDIAQEDNRNISQEAEKETISKPNNQVLEFTSKKAEPIGGFPALASYLDTAVKYTEQALLDKAEGKVMVKFVVNDKGYTEKIQVLQGVHPDLDSIAIEVIKNMPQWNPAMSNGYLVKSSMKLPINFQITSDSTNRNKD